MKLSKITIASGILGSILGMTILVSAFNAYEPSTSTTTEIETPRARVKLAKHQAKILSTYRAGFLWQQRTTIQYSDGYTVQRDGKLGNVGDIIESKRGFFE